MLRDLLLSIRAMGGVTMLLGRHQPSRPQALRHGAHGRASGAAEASTTQLHTRSPDLGQGGGIPCH